MTEIIMKITIKTLMIFNCFFSSISLATWPFNKSSVRVELEARTNDESVDIEADKTKMTTTASKISGKPDSITGITES